MFTEMLNDHFFAWKKIIDFRYANFLKSSDHEIKDIDVAFVEGAICSDKDKEKLLKIRKAAKYVVAIGACAVTGLPSGHRNNFSEEMKKEIAPYLLQFHQNERVYALHELIEVDDKVAGCPMIEAQLVQAFDKYLKMYKIIAEDDSIANHKD
jgi:coenzyme F420-reducing hydrogenase gamma subunit